MHGAIAHKNHDRFLLDDSADSLEETVSEDELENEEIDLDFTIVTSMRIV